jgi:hypothetical protein
MCTPSEVSAMELHYVLSSFGISPHHLPVSILGNIKTGTHNTWVQDRAAKEKLDPFIIDEHVITDDASLCGEDLGGCNSYSSGETSLDWPKRPLPLSLSSDVVDPQPATPTCNDVLFGRGKVKHHPGNVLLHSLIDQRRFSYEVAPKWGKTAIAEEIVSIIKERCGRFLKLAKRKDNESRAWVVVGKDDAREKVAHTFRSKRHR